MKKYVLGFAFTEGLEDVLLIQKNRPEWQAGLLNGIGGKIEDFDITPEVAMVREFIEECGISTNPTDWTHYATMQRDDDFIVYCYFAVLPCESIDTMRSVTDEQVWKYDVREITAGVCVTTSNLPMLVSMAVSSDVTNGQIAPISIKYFEK